MYVPLLTYVLFLSLKCRVFAHMMTIMMSERTLCCSVRSAPSQKKKEIQMFSVPLCSSSRSGRKRYSYFFSFLRLTPTDSHVRCATIFMETLRADIEGGDEGSLAQFSPLSRLLPRDSFLRFVAASPLLLFLSWVGSRRRQKRRETDRTQGRRRRIHKKRSRERKEKGRESSSLLSLFPAFLRSIQSLPSFSPSPFPSPLLVSLLPPITNPILFLLLLRP